MNKCNYGSFRYKHSTSRPPRAIYSVPTVASPGPRCSLLLQPSCMILTLLSPNAYEFGFTSDLLPWGLGGGTINNLCHVIWAPSLVGTDYDKLYQIQ